MSDDSVMINRSNSTLKMLQRCNTLFLLLTGLCLFYLMSNRSMFQLGIPNWFPSALVTAMCVTAGMKLLLLDPRTAELRIAPFFILLYGMIYRSDGYLLLITMAALTVGMIGIDYQRIIRVYLFSVGASLAIIILAALSGLIPNLVYLRDGVLRSSWGIHYPTDFASFTVFLSLFIWVSWKSLPDWAMLVLNLFPTWIAWSVAGSRTSLISCLLFDCIIIYHMLTQRLILRSSKLSRSIKKADQVLIAVFPLTAFFMMFLLFSYWKGYAFSVTADRLLSSRLRLALDAFRQYKVTAFGTPFQMIGSGGSVFSRSNYNFVDSSFFLIPLRYGWVMMIAVFLFWSWIIIKSLRAGDRRLALITFIIAFHSFSEHHFVDVYHNILFVMPLASYPLQKFSSKEQEDPGKAGAAVATAGLCTGIMFLSPILVSNLRTFFQAWDKHDHIQYLFILIVLLILVILTAVLWSAHRLLECFFHRTAPQKADLVVLAAACLLGLGMCGYRNAQLNRISPDTNDQDALKIAVRSATGHVYSDIDPERLIQSVSGVKRSIFSGEDFARFTNVTFLTSDRTDGYVLFHKNFRYCRVSDNHAIYTNDPAVISALSDAGYHVAGYNSTWISVDLSQMECSKELFPDAGGAITLNGLPNSLSGGPQVELHNGHYSLRMELTLQNSAAEDDLVCKIMVYANHRASVLAEAEVTGDSFDHNGHYTLILPFTVYDYSGGISGIEFPVYVQGGHSLVIQDFSYAETPEFDIHKTYDSSGLIMREEYFTLDGIKQNNEDGYFAIEYEYGSEGDPRIIRYYDVDNQPVLTSGGYAELHEYTQTSPRSIRYEYYGRDGKRIMLPGGYAIVERVFDENGDEIITRYFDEDAQPTLWHLGYAERRCVYDAHHHLIRRAYFGTDGKPILLPEGYCVMESDFDEDGNEIAIRYYDLNGRSVDG